MIIVSVDALCQQPCTGVVRHLMRKHPNELMWWDVVATLIVYDDQLVQSAAVPPGSDRVSQLEVLHETPCSPKVTLETHTNFVIQLAVCRAAPGWWTPARRTSIAISGTQALTQWPTMTLSIKHTCNGPRQKHKILPLQWGSCTRLKTSIEIPQMHKGKRTS